VLQPFVLRVMVLAIQTGNHGGELLIGKDKVALVIVAFDEHAY
jgi:hypothetical protein